jgi:hypothetical protein
MTNKCDRRDQVQRLLEKIKATDSLPEARSAASAALNLTNRYEIFDAPNVDTSFLRAQLSAKDSEIAILRRQMRELDHWRSIGLRQQAIDREARLWAEKIREQRVESLVPEILDLFAAEPVQQGMAAIAKKLGRQQEPIRRAISKLVDAGEIVVTGSTRNRTYSRPTQDGRESFASDADQTQNVSGDSRPRQVRRKRVA